MYNDAKYSVTVRPPITSKFLLMRNTRVLITCELCYRCRYNGLPEIRQIFKIFVGSLYVYVTRDLLQRAEYFQPVRMHGFDTLAKTVVGEHLLKPLERLVQDR